MGKVNFEQLNKSFINGEWVNGESSQTFKDLNPYDNSVIATFSLATKEQVQSAFLVAEQAQKLWAQTNPDERKEVISKAIQYLNDHKDEIVEIIVKETGGSVLKANVEFGLTLEVMEEALNYADKVNTVEEVPSSIEGKINKIYRLPLGVISSISPFNFPMNLSMRSIIPAIALGNAVVHKPDVQVGLVGGSILAKAFEEAGLPKGLFNMIITDISVIGDEMLTNSIPKLISFTGSTGVGRHIGKIAGEHLKRTALELGGNSPFVVLSDANVPQAVNAAIFGKFIHQGQICMAINRIIVHQSKYDQFVKEFVERVKNIPYGDPRAPQNIIGPLINNQQLEKAQSSINEAIKSGVNVALEGKRIGNIITPYVFTDVENSSKLSQTEMFAPIANIIKAESDEQAIEFANDTEYGLSSAIFTSDIEKGEQLALAIDAGMTHVNDQTVNDAPNIPFGGNKSSGLGRFGNPWIVDEFTITKWVSVQSQNRQYPF